MSVYEVEYSTPAYPPQSAEKTTEDGRRGTTCECEPCNHRQKLTRSQKYCYECSEYLCDQCASIHRSMKFGKRHSVLNSLQLRNKVKEDADELNRKISNLIDGTNNYIKASKDNYHEHINEIRLYKEDIIRILNQLEAKLTDNLNKDIQFDMGILHKTREKCVQIKSEISDINHKLQQKAKDDIKKYTEMHDTLRNLQKETEKQQLHGFIYSLQKGDIYLDCLSEPNGLGEFKKIAIAMQTPVHIEKARFQRIDDINLSCDGEITKCWITGMDFVPPDSLLLADCGNNRVKSFDIRQQTINSYLQFQTLPWDIAAMGPNLAAVTLPDQQLIKLISIRKGLKICANIKVDGYCQGVTATKNRLLVSVEARQTEAKIIILDHFGGILREIKLQRLGCSFKYPKYICANHKQGETMIYVRDGYYNRITKLSMEGQILQTWLEETDQYSVIPGMSMSANRMLLLCNKKLDSIQTMNVNAHSANVSRDPFSELITDKYGLKGPASVCHIHSHNLLCVCGEDYNQMAVYKLEIT